MSAAAKKRGLPNVVALPSDYSLNEYLSNISHWIDEVEVAAFSLSADSTGEPRTEAIVKALEQAVAKLRYWRCAVVTDVREAFGDDAGGEDGAA